MDHHRVLERPSLAESQAPISEMEKKMETVKKPLFDGDDTFRAVEAWVIEPDDIEERMNRLREAHQKAPEFTIMLTLAFSTSPNYSFKGLAEIWPEKDGLEVNPKNEDVKDFFYKDFTKDCFNWTDASPNKSKLVPCIQLLEWTDVSDVEVIKEIIFGRNPVNPRINEKMYGDLLGELLS